jgi:hypothetical protein
MLRLMNLRYIDMVYPTRRVQTSTKNVVPCVTGMHRTNGSNCLIDYLPEERADTYRYKTILPARYLLADVHGSACEAPPPRHHHLADACTLLPATETRSLRNTMISSVESTTRWGLLLCRALVEFQLPGRLLQLPGRRAPTPGASIPAPIASSVGRDGNSTKPFWAFDSAWLLSPQQGELFEAAKEYMRRLQIYALSRGFAVVTLTSKLKRACFACIYHGSEQYSTSVSVSAISQRLNDLTATGLQVLTARDTLTGLSKARFDNQLFKTNKVLLEFAGQVAQDDLLPTRLPDKMKKPKWAKPRKPHGKASGRSFTGAEAAEMAADKAEKSSKMPDRRPTREDSPESCDGEAIMPATPPRPAQLAGESQGGNTITLALRTPERLRLGPDLAPRVTPPGETEPAWQLPASTAPPALVRPRQG